MIREFAIEPEALSELNMLWQALEQFGVSHGRMISQFPKHWLREVYEATAGCPPTQRAHMEIRINRLKAKLARFHTRSPTEEHNTWRKKAHSAHLQEQFHAIVQSDNDEGHESVLTAFDLTDDNPTWKVSTGSNIPRTPEAIASTLGSLGRISKNLLFVDPHFGNERRWSSVLVAALNECQAAGGGHRRIEYHTGAVPNRATLEASAKQHIARQLSQSVQIRFVLWEPRDAGERMHARYFLTERGGIRFDFGLDAGAPGQTTDVGLLSEELYTERWNNYQNDTAAYNMVDEFVLRGTAR